MCSFPRCLSFWLCARSAGKDAWISSVKQALQDERGVSISNELRQVLLLDTPDDFSSLPRLLLGDNINDEINNDGSSPSFLLKGLPKHPIYMELGSRLHLISIHKHEGIPLLLPASHFCLSEFDTTTTTTSLILSMLPNYPTKRSMMDWINNVGSTGILLVLGMRSTVGTPNDANLLPPSWTDLLYAASLQHSENTCLSVAARARSKHYHRGKEQFFGVVKGPPQDQNDETETILIKLMKNAAWINIHTFGGTDGDLFLEIRVEAGYGARWKVTWSDTSICSAVAFRGFLEPQMTDGHDKKWRH